MSPFDHLRARGLIVQSLALGAAIVTVIMFATPARLVGTPMSRGFEAALGVVTYLSVALVLAGRGWLAGLNWKALFGPPPTRAPLPLLAIVVPVILLTIGAATAVYVPLSYVAPRFVESLVNSNSLFDVRSLEQWVWVVVLGVVVAPIVEELFFRGFLLHRWARRWDTGTAVIASSALFALLHSEWIGHFVFGVAMALLYLETRRLWLPMLAHALNNGIVALFALSDVVRHAPPEVTSIAELRADWPMGVGALVAGLVLMRWCLQRWWPHGRWRSVLRGRMPYDVYDAFAASPPTTTSTS